MRNLVLRLRARGCPKPFPADRRYFANDRYAVRCRLGYTSAMEWIDDGIVVAVRRHGETSMLVSLLTSQHGRHAGLIRTGSKGVTQGLLQAGNRVRARWRARLAEHLGTLSCELTEAIAARHMDDTKRLTCLVAACAVAETALPDREPHPRVFRGLAALLEGLDADAKWGSAYVKWEVGVLGDLGFGLDLSRCAVTGGKDHLHFVSPRTGRAVSEAATGAYRHRLLRLPSFLLVQGATGGKEEVVQALELTGHFLERHVYNPCNHNLPSARVRLARLFRD